MLINIQSAIDKKLIQFFGRRYDKDDVFRREKKYERLQKGGECRGTRQLMKPF